MSGGSDGGAGKASVAAWAVPAGLCSAALLGVADPAVQYFGANMLYGKCKSDWGTLPEAHRGAFSEAVGTHLSRLAGAPGSSLAARRLCLVMAAAATRMATTGLPAGSMM